MRSPLYIFHCTLYILLVLASCSPIPEDQQLIYVKPAPAKRVVLLEDFTGQRCVNCPKGTEIIEQLQQTYGDTAFIAVGIHGGPLGFKGNARVLGLATDVGNEYFDHWQLEYQPVGLVNRHGALSYTDWTRAVGEELSTPAPLELTAQAGLYNGEIDIHILASGTDGTTTGRLQVWVVEDSITAMQLMPDGTANNAYVHNHVLRTPVNGTWGEPFTIEEAELRPVAMTQPLDTAWNLAHLSIVAFVYNDNGVQQAVKTKVIGH